VVELVLNLDKDVLEATVRVWFLEEGDAVEEGDDILELSTENGLFRIQAPVSGLISEVYYDEGETVEKGEVLCLIDEEDDGGEDDKEAPPKEKERDK